MLASHSSLKPQTHWEHGIVAISSKDLPPERRKIQILWVKPSITSRPMSSSKSVKLRMEPICPGCFGPGDRASACELKDPRLWAAVYSKHLYFPKFYTEERRELYTEERRELYLESSLSSTWGGGRRELSEGGLKCSAVVSWCFLSGDEEFLTLNNWSLNCTDKLGTFF